MFLIIRVMPDRSLDCFGPFPSERMAEQYAESFGDEKDIKWTITPLIVPNCVQVKLMY